MSLNLWMVDMFDNGEVVVRKDDKGKADEKKI